VIPNHPVHVKADPGWVRTPFCGNKGGTMPGQYEAGTKAKAIRPVA